MEGYHLRCRCVPIEEARTSTEGPSTSAASHATIERPEEGLVSEGHSRLLAGQPGAGVPLVMRTHDTQASSDRSEATLRGLLANPSQTFSDVRAAPDVAEIPDLEAKAYVNVGASISPPDLDVEVSANTGPSILA